MKRHSDQIFFYGRQAGMALYWKHMLPKVWGYYLEDVSLDVEAAGIFVKLCSESAPINGNALLWFSVVFLHVDACVQLGAFGHSERGGPASLASRS